VESDDRGLVGGIEMAGNGITDHGFQFVQRIRFGEDRKVQRASFIPPSGDSWTEKMISLGAMRRASLELYAPVPTGRYI